ncbi:MAG TPA: CoA ester lyase, partial [Petrotogaceae bacterium]|nr:CoA ester lyase [Petrotogaceae bacterium]
PKVQKAQEIVYIDQSITEIENELSLPGGIIKFMVSIESALGVINIKEICQASTRLIGVAFGAEDFTYDMGVKRTKEGNELAFARSTLALTARAYGKIAIDCVFSDTKDPEGLRKDCEIARSFGMTGKSVIHPGQIEVVNKSFSPSDQEIGQARRVIELYKKLGCPGVFSFEGNMVDLPVLKKYQRIYELYGRDKVE